MKKNILIILIVLTQTFFFTIITTSTALAGGFFSKNTNTQYLYDNPYHYESFTGTQYKYDLSNPVDRMKYSIDYEAQRKDALWMPVSPSVGLDRELNQYGGGMANPWDMAPIAIPYKRNNFYNNPNRTDEDAASCNIYNSGATYTGFSQSFSKKQPAQPDKVEVVEVKKEPARKPPPAKPMSNREVKSVFLIIGEVLFWNLIP